jgi:type III secretion protein N (ATPase)
MAEVVGFSNGEVVMLPLGDTQGIGPDSLVEATGQAATIACSDAMLGRVLNGLGEPIDDLEPLDAAEMTRWPLFRPAPDPLKRPRIEQSISTGLRVIDGLATLGQGQRLGLFAGSGVGKSTLLGQLAQNADVDICVVCLVGERGRELREFVESSLADGLNRSVVVCATSDAPPLVRLRSATVATAIAEYFREQGKRVLILMDSITRYARALREVALAAGEPPARRGYPASVFTKLPKLLERAGNSEKGSMTAVYAVLVEGEDMDEPIADEIRGILDGHVVLSRKLAHRNHWPAVDVLASLSRLMTSITDDAHQRAAANLRKHLAVYEDNRDLIALGAYKRGSDIQVDAALNAIDKIQTFLKQGSEEVQPLQQTRLELLSLLDD